MTKIQSILATIVIITALNSCSTIKNVDTFSTGDSRLEYTLDDFKYLGQSEISGDYDVYLRGITHINRINGAVYDPGNVTKVYNNGSTLSLNNRVLKIAAAKVLEDYPEADYFIVTREVISKDRLFLGSTYNASAIIKAYKLVERKKHPVPHHADNSDNSDNSSYSLDEMAQMVAEGKDVRGKTIRAVNTINFDLNSATIKPESYNYLDRVAKILKQTGANIKVNGHTDNIGSDATNLKLSEDRAKSVVNYLVNHGVDRNKIMSEGYGPKRPIASNDTEEGRAANRRVEFEILK